MNKQTPGIFRGVTVLALLLLLGMLASAPAQAQRSRSNTTTTFTNTVYVGPWGKCDRPYGGNGVLVDCDFNGMYADQFGLVNWYYQHPGPDQPVATFELSRLTFVRTIVISTSGCTILGVTKESQQEPELADTRPPCAGMGRVETLQEEEQVDALFDQFCTWIHTNPPLFQIPGAEFIFCAS